MHISVMAWNNIQKFWKITIRLHCISIERCGKNIEDDYANMRGVSIKKNTAKADTFLILPKARNPRHLVSEMAEMKSVWAI